ncbi:MAG: hypothetical protein ABIA37_00410 [Candidatus Woesearchaeota archaeon]
MAKRAWFVKKGAGLLFIPVSWQGWISLILMLALLLTSAYLNKLFAPDLLSLQDRARLLFEIVIILLISVLFFDSHTKRKFLR